MLHKILVYLSRYTNPKLTGVVVKEGVKCGKKNCHCHEGKLHKEYYYLYYRSFENGRWRLKKEYVRRSKVKYLKGKIKEMKNKDKAAKARLSSNTSFLKATFGYSRGNLSADELLKTIHEITETN